MKPHQIRITLIVVLLLACVGWAWHFLTQSDDEPALTHAEDSGHRPKVDRPKAENAQADQNNSSTPNLETKLQDTDFPINDKIELPFLGVVPCHSRQEKVQFTFEGKQKEWPFKVCYLPNGMLVRAEFFKSGAKDYEFPAAEMQGAYKSWGQYIVGFPEKSAPATLGKVLESLYTNEAFDSATKINITYVLLDERKNGGIVQPSFIANIWGVSTGIMEGSVPEDDEGFKKYRVFLNQNGVPTFTDNGL